LWEKLIKLWPTIQLTHYVAAYDLGWLLLLSLLSYGAASDCDSRPLIHRLVSLLHAVAICASLSSRWLSCLLLHLNELLAQNSHIFHECLYFLLEATILFLNLGDLVFFPLQGFLVHFTSNPEITCIID